MNWHFGILDLVYFHLVNFKRICHLLRNSLSFKQFNFERITPRTLELALLFILELYALKWKATLLNHSLRAAEGNFFCWWLTSSRKSECKMQFITQVKRTIIWRGVSLCLLLWSHKVIDTYFCSLKISITVFAFTEIKLN